MVDERVLGECAEPCPEPLLVVEHGESPRQFNHYGLADFAGFVLVPARQHQEEFVEARTVGVIEPGQRRLRRLGKSIL